MSSPGTVIAIRFWVTWQPADPDEDAQKTQNTEFRWGVAQGGVWHWDRINHWLDGGTFEREWKFKEAGETLLRIGVREDATHDRYNLRDE